MEGEGLSQKENESDHHSSLVLHILDFAVDTISEYLT